MLSEILPQLGMIQRVASGLTAIPGPQQGAVARAAGVITSPSDRAKALSNLLNYVGGSALLGGSLSTMTPGAMTGELMQRAAVQKVELTDAAAKAGVDLTWVKDQLRKGLTPDQVTALVAQGKGAVPAQPVVSKLDASKLAKQRAALEAFRKNQ